MLLDTRGQPAGQTTGAAAELSTDRTSGRGQTAAAVGQAAAAGQSEAVDSHSEQSTTRTQPYDFYENSKGAPSTTQTTATLQEEPVSSTTGQPSPHWLR